jgi:cephalosporin-C deacetylase-like acetyl esterase
LPILAGKQIAPVVAFNFPSFDGLPVEAFLTEPDSLDPNRKYPMIVVIHGGPHGQQGSMFDFKSQVYASHGYATLMVNYRGLPATARSSRTQFSAIRTGGKDSMYSPGPRTPWDSFPGAITAG